MNFIRGIPVAKDPASRGSAREAIAFLKAQNAALSNDRLVELTYGPKRPVIEKFTPQWAKMEKKTLCFDGVTKEAVDDWDTEPYRLRFVKVYYFLENDTIRVVEPEVSNSTLCQGIQLKRDHYLHPSRGRNYNWKDLNIGNNIHIFGRDIHLYDCDTWTKQYLTDAGIEVNTPEPKPSDPYMKMKKNMAYRQEYYRPANECGDTASSLNFYRNDGKVLRFYGIWKNDPDKPPAVRRIILKYYLVDDTVEVQENNPPSSGWGTLMSANARTMDIASVGGCSFTTLLHKQRIMLDRQKVIGKLPCYLQPRDIDDVAWMKSHHLKTGEDLVILGKIFFLSKSDEFTRQYYRDNLGIDLPQMEVMEKPKPMPPKLIPPYWTGRSDETVQDCFKLHCNPPEKIHYPIPAKPQEIVNTVLRFAASMDTPRETERIRRFTISFFMEDDTTKIYEEEVPNSGFGSGIFLKRKHLKKTTGNEAETTYYEAKDFHIGARIRACGSTFVLTDADLLVFDFMENHPEIYTDINVEDQKKLVDILKGKIEMPHSQKMRLLEDLRNSVAMNYGCSVYPIEAVPALGSRLAPRKRVDEELYSGNLPISQELLKRLVDAFTFEGRTNVDEVRTFLLVALGHDRDHSK